MISAVIMRRRTWDLSPRPGERSLEGDEVGEVNVVVQVEVEGLAFGEERLSIWIDQARLQDMVVRQIDVAIAIRISTQRVEPSLERADVAAAATRPSDAALIGCNRAIFRGDRVDGRASGQQGVRLRGPAVVGERAEQRIDRAGKRISGRNTPTIAGDATEAQYAAAGVARSPKRFACWPRI